MTVMVQCSARAKDRFERRNMLAPHSFTAYIAYMNIAADRIDLSDHDAELLAQASRLMSEALDRSGARRIALVEEKADGSDFARLEVPPATLRLLSQILALMARQQTFVLYPESSELTTKQAAEVLGVSRPFLIRVLEAGEIPYRKVGRHRRVLMKDVLAYKQKMQVKSSAAMDELVKLSEEMGGYDHAGVTAGQLADIVSSEVSDE
jgi:excisionase family DNA binding protein